MVRFSIKRTTPVKPLHKTTKRFELAKIPKSLILLLLVVLAGLTFGAYRYADKPETTAQEVVSTDQATQKIDFSPATEEDKAETDDRKASLVNNENQESPTDLRVVTPVIVGSNNSSPVSVRSYVSGVIESGGMCTLTLSNGSASLTTEGVATAGAQTTDCPELAITVPSPGTWKAKISYTSITSQGTSAQDWEITIE